MTNQWLVTITAEAEVIPGDPKPDHTDEPDQTDDQPAGPCAPASAK